ncbi:hypothetical protein PLICRDRAFT_57188 [Plicaturopsis crispa FD-325 SS-3]|uniref:Uncharacterized protein n=1 Tax=Plicaturopsis crispa FD-325 SS-3 TaxID=944288 RepID=A0A0C9T7G1_PLICR|nr:hypothetical protein PLICRDRAFT_57188 [Plicaturopsis crispa FD-325 SS-3]
MTDTPTTTITTTTDAAPVYGLTYPASLLDSLEKAHPTNAPPVHLLPPETFAALHFSHISNHAPDTVLFPFLHGLEGGNEAQNRFFAQSQSAGASPSASVPRYRGLVWVVCEDDVELPPSPCSSLYDSDEDVYDDDIDNMDVDPDAAAAHMHPVAQRSNRPLVSPIDTNPTSADSHDRRASDASTTSTTSTAASSLFPSESDCPSPATSYTPSEYYKKEDSPPTLLTSTFRPKDLIREVDGHWEFTPLRVPDGISLRNFGIQVPVYSTLSDIVVYSPHGATQSAIELAGRFKQAIERKREERIKHDPLEYNVFVLTDLHHPSIEPLIAGGPFDFAQREKEEMRDLTRATEIVSLLPPPPGPSPTDVLSGSTTAKHYFPCVGQVFLGNADDVPLAPPNVTNSDDPFDYTGTNDPAAGFGYDVCVECHDLAPVPTAAHLRAAEEHLATLDAIWAERGKEGPRPPVHASSVVHLPFPSSPMGTPTNVNALMPVIRFLERCLQPLPPPSPSRSSSFTALFSREASTNTTKQQQVRRTRPLKILLYSADGYTESSVPALCLLMAVRDLSLPEAYLELQVVKRRSFFVYQGDLNVLRRVEQRLASERGGGGGYHPYVPRPHAHSTASTSGHHHYTSSSYTDSPLSASPMVVPSQGHLVKTRPRASTSPWLPGVFDDHQAWFSDPRFDGSFPSRVLPFLYLGNLNHASNAYMLHALGITHVVSVGECALVPPPHAAQGTAPSVSRACAMPGPGAHYIPGKGPGAQGSLWIEEREGRIKVLDIQGVCDDGIDTLEPQLAPICEWIERARAAGGQVLVHCRVGVSRSATVAIAYVMQHLGVPLVEAYLIVRSRRLSVLIQPNMRLLYNLCGWERHLAKARAGGDEERLRKELSRSMNWPYLAREVHLLNEKYLH